MQIKVMTFNLRIDVPVDGDNQWRHRVASVLAMIRDHQPDVLMLQETTPAMLKDLAELDRDYDHYYVGRNQDLLGEGCPLYFRRSLFKMRLNDTIWLSATPRTAGSMDPDEGFPRIASMVVLQHQQGPLFRFVNTHLAYRSARAKDLNLKVLFDFVQSFPDSLPLIIGGDFNDVIDFIKPYMPRRFTLGLTINEGNTIHDFHGGEGTAQIDHLIFGEPWHLQTIKVDRRSFFNRLPSDHYPVIGVFRYES